MNRVVAKRTTGFTIVELLIVVVVIAILAAITIVAYNGISNRAKASSMQSDLSSASKQIKLFHAEKSTYPVANDCAATPAANTICLKPSNGTTFNYIAVNDKSPQTFCITATQGSTTWYQGVNGTPQQGTCLDYGLITHLDANNTASYSGSGTAWNDLTSNGNNGTVSGATFTTTNGSSFLFDGVDDYVSSTNSREYVDTVVIYRPDFTHSNANILTGIISSGTSGDRSLRFTNVNGTGPWRVQNPGNVNDWTYPTTSVYTNGVSTNQASSGWNILSAYRSNQDPFPKSFAYHLGVAGQAGRYFKGQIAVVLLFDRPLADSERVQYFERYRSRFGL